MTDANEIETEKWTMFFMPSDNPHADGQVVDLRIRLRSNVRGISRIGPEELKELESDLKDLGKWRKFKELREDLEG